jgi:type I restriction enzyme M protein
MRSNVAQFGRRSQLTRAHFHAFETAFGKDPLGSSNSLAKRVDTGEAGRFRKFERDWIAKRDDSLDIAWLKADGDVLVEDLPEPAELARTAIKDLEGALDELLSMLAELGDDAGRPGA